MSKEKLPADWDEALDGEWDDEFVSEQALAEGADLELICEYLNGHLDAARAEEVRTRLDEDPAFFELAEPMIIAWSVPRYRDRHPVSPEETERAWKEFARRAGIDPG